MKLHLTYWPSEARKASTLCKIIESFFEGTRIKRKSEPDGKRHVYFKSDP